MTVRRRLAPRLLALLALLATGCAEVVPQTPPPASIGTLETPTPGPSATERPFASAAWPADGNACDLPGYAGRLGRVEALAARTVRFTLCAPDGAFPARLAHPALGVIDATSVDLVAADPGAARTVPGAGAFRLDDWTSGDNLRLARVAPASAPSSTTSASPLPPLAPVATPGMGPGSAPGPGESAAPVGPPPVIVLRWAASSAARAAAVREAEVDGMDAPDAGDAAELEGLPEVTVVPRAGLATAYLGFGAGRTFAPAPVRRAFAEALDHQALAREVFPAGSAPATHISPCEVPHGCAGLAWYEFNGPAASAALDAAGFDRRATIPLHVPDGPVPGLPDPAAVGTAIRDQLAESVEVSLEVVAVPVEGLRASIADGTMRGLYLDAVTATLADPSGFLEPLFGEAATGDAARRAKGVRAALEDAARATEPAAREAAFEAANDALRAAAAVVPLAHAGSTSAYRSDVTGVAVSPMGVDPLGNFIPGDRGQLVVMQPAEPEAAWCGVASSPEALRLCALVTPGLLAFERATLAPVPALAGRCTATDGATVWTCRLRPGLEFSDGKRVDAADVLASVRAQADAGGPLRSSLPVTAFAAWDALFGGPVPRPGS